ncbi:MAG: hypothetical protein R3F43_16310 [bacterium]
MVAPDPAPPHVASAADLPAARGPMGHVRHAAAAVRLLWVWRRQLQELDDQLRDAVERRDARVAALGEATAALDPPPAALAGYFDTLQALAAESAEAVVIREREAASLASEEQAARERLAAEDARVDAAREVQSPLERRLRELRSRQGELEQAATSRATQRRNQEVRGTRVRERLEDATLEPPQRAALEEEAESIVGRLADLAAGAEADELALAELAEPIAQLRAEVATAAEALEEARESRRQARLDTDERLARQRAALKAAENAEQALLRRRQAVLVDLGLATLEQPDLDVPGRAAAAGALEHLDRLRDARSRLDHERAALDRTALYRTVLVGVGVLVGLLLLKAIW